MQIVLNRQLLGLEDLAFGLGTVEQTRGDQVVTVTLINAANLPFNETQTLLEVLTVDYPMIEVVGTDIINVNLVATNIDEINTIVDNLVEILTVAGDTTEINAIFTQIIPNLAEILQADTNADIATTKAAEALSSAETSQLKTWESEAWTMTANSYATEAEDVFVKVYTSDGDGTFTATDTTEYSSFHWQQKAFTLVADGIINDITPTADKVYSSLKTQALHDAQAVAISNLSGASATFYSNTMQPVPEDPSAFVDLTWTNNQASTNADILELGTNSFILKQNGSYNFFNSLTFSRLDSGSAMNVTFELYNSVTSTVLATFVQLIDITAGTTETIPMNALLNISGLSIGQSVDVKVRMQASNAAGTLELLNFNSILALASVSSTATIDAIDAAMGTIYEGLA